MRPIILLINRVAGQVIHRAMDMAGKTLSSYFNLETYISASCITLCAIITMKFKIISLHIWKYRYWFEAAFFISIYYFHPTRDWRENASKIIISSYMFNALAINYRTAGVQFNSTRFPSFIIVIAQRKKQVPFCTHFRMSIEKVGLMNDRCPQHLRMRTAKI